jgi:hypothetical protein
VFLPDNNHIIRIQELRYVVHVPGCENPICGHLQNYFSILVFFGDNQLLFLLKGGIGKLSNNATDFEIAKTLVAFSLRFNYSSIKFPVKTKVL